MNLAWRPRDVPLAPRVAVARGDAALALVWKLRALDDDALARLAGAAGDGTIVLRTADAVLRAPAKPGLAIVLRTADAVLRAPAKPGLAIAVAGDADALPWVDGVMYLGRDDAAPSLLLPTALAPVPPVALVERAIRAWLRGVATPIALLHGDGRPTAVLPLGGLRPIDRAHLEAIP